MSMSIHLDIPEYLVEYYTEISTRKSVIELLQNAVEDAIVREYIKIICKDYEKHISDLQELIHDIRDT